MITLTGYELVAATTVRLYIATEAMKAIIGNPEILDQTGKEPENIVEVAFKFANAMIKEYNKGNTVI